MASLQEQLSALTAQLEALELDRKKFSASEWKHHRGLILKEICNFDAVYMGVILFLPNF